MADLFANQVHAIFQPTTIVISDFSTTSASRFWALRPSSAPDLFPGVPTLAEQGFPQLIANSWNGLCTPAGTPAPIVSRLDRAAVPRGAESG